MSAREKSGDPKGSPWNSLEAAKLFVSAMTPLFIILIGALLSQQSSRESVALQKSNQAQLIQAARYDAVIKKRVELWDSLGPKLSKITRYFFFDEHTDSVRNEASVKRLLEECDTEVDAYSPYFSSEFVDKYSALSSTLTESLGKEIGEGQKTRIYKSYRALFAAVADDLALKVESEEAKR